MVSKWDDVSVEAALDRSLRSAKHLRAVDAALVKAARELARKIDAWSTIVDYALEDADGGRPAVPANDNVSLATFLKYCDVLGLKTDVVKAVLVPAHKPNESPVEAMKRQRQKRQIG